MLKKLRKLLNTYAKIAYVDIKRNFKNLDRYRIKKFLSINDNHELLSMDGNDRMSSLQKLLLLDILKYNTSGSSLWRFNNFEARIYFCDNLSNFDETKNYFLVAYNSKYLFNKMSIIINYNTVYTKGNMYEKFIINAAYDNLSRKNIVPFLDVPWIGSNINMLLNFYRVKQSKFDVKKNLIEFNKLLIENKQISEYWRERLLQTINLQANQYWKKVIKCNDCYVLKNTRKILLHQSVLRSWPVTFDSLVEKDLVCSPCHINQDFPPDYFDCNCIIKKDCAFPLYHIKRNDSLLCIRLNRGSYCGTWAKYYEVRLLNEALSAKN
jgi:hypothetical protein